MVERKNENTEGPDNTSKGRSPAGQPNTPTPAGQPKTLNAAGHVMLSAYANSGTEVDKAVLTLASFGVGLHVALVSSQGVGNAMATGFGVASVFVFVLTIFAALAGIRSANEKLKFYLKIDGDDAKEHWLSRNQKCLDNVMIGLFFLGVLFSLGVGAVGMVDGKAEISGDSGKYNIVLDARTGLNWLINTQSGEAQITTPSVSGYDDQGEPILTVEWREVVAKEPIDDLTLSHQIRKRLSDSGVNEEDVLGIMQSGDALLDAGFSEDEIVAYLREVKQTMLDAGFSEAELEESFVSTFRR